jgi:hypothetical protein
VRINSFNPDANWINIASPFGANVWRYYDKPFTAQTDDTILIIKDKNRVDGVMMDKVMLGSTRGYPMLFETLKQIRIEVEKSRSLWDLPN